MAELVSALKLKEKFIERAMGPDFSSSITRDVRSSLTLETVLESPASPFLVLFLHVDFLLVFDLGFEMLDLALESRYLILHHCQLTQKLNCGRTYILRKKIWDSEGRTVLSLMELLQILFARELKEEECEEEEGEEDEKELSQKGINYIDFKGWTRQYQSNDQLNAFSRAG
ncbi:fatty acid reductase 4 [Striga asiatica]|uniref:Fatty acid reductase 4 n=1 Tax=Striga asiatica TaxID=4170 RepID=A0A5A7Q3K3_STRAF|nr:fatty acid reductase 4 [Striga asiatica]